MPRQEFTPGEDVVVSDKERKKLRGRFQAMVPTLTEGQLEDVFPQQSGKCTMMKVKGQLRLDVYLLNDLPLVMESPKHHHLIPSLYVLWKMPQLLSHVFVKHSSVSESILGGKDLLSADARPSFRDAFQRNVYVSVCVPGNPCPFAIGRSLMSSMDGLQNRARQRVLVEIVHFYGDAVSTLSSNLVPPNKGFTSTSIHPIETLGYFESDTIDTSTPEILHEGVVRAETTVPAPTMRRKKNEMDALLHQCFFQALRKSVKDRHLPLSASELWFKHMLPNESVNIPLDASNAYVCRQPDAKLDMKSSSYKKLSKFLHQFAVGDEPLLCLRVEKFTKETIVIAIDRYHDAYREFRPAEARHQTEDGDNSKDTDLKIVELYRMGPELDQVLMSIGLQPGDLLSKKDADEVIFRYVTHADLDQGIPDKQHVILDSVLGEALLRALVKKDEQLPKYLHKAKLKGVAMKYMHPQYHITRGTLKWVKRGTWPQVRIRTEKRKGHSVTYISGLKPFLIDMEELATVAGQRFGCSVTVHEVTTKGGNQKELLLRADKGRQAAALLQDMYSIPKKLIGDHFGQHPALPVPEGEPDWDSGSPKTAEEYLRRVRWEAAHCQQITRSDIDVAQFEAKQTEYVPKVRTVAEAPAFCQPTKTWIMETLKDFQQLHEHFEQSKEDDDELPMGVPIPINHAKLEEHAEVMETGLESVENDIPPQMEFIAALDQVEALQLVKEHIGAFVKLKKLEDVSDVRCYWLYALLSRIHRPLHATSAAIVRSLFKQCSHLRLRYSKTWTRLSSQERTEMEDAALLPRLNLLYVISGIYFGQDEKMTGIADFEGVRHG